MGSYVILTARTNNAADDVRSMIVEMDVLAHLIGLLQDRYPEVREELMNAITTLVKFGWLNISFCITQILNPDGPTDDVRSKMAETDVVEYLVGLLRNSHSDYERKSSAKAIITLAKFGTSLSLF